MKLNGPINTHSGAPHKHAAQTCGIAYIHPQVSSDVAHRVLCIFFFRLTDAVSVLSRARNYDNVSSLAAKALVEVVCRMCSL